MNKRFLSGSITLEAAFGLVVTMVFCLALCLSILSVQATMHLQQALDQTGREYAQIQLAQSLWQSRPKSDSLEAARNGQTDRTELKTLQETVKQTHLLGPFVLQRIRHWYNKQIQAKPYLHHVVGQMKILIKPNQLNGLTLLRLSYSVPTGVIPLERQLQLFVPDWRYQAHSMSQQQFAKASDNIWEKSNFERGKQFRQLFGANLPTFFPVIAKQKSGVVTSIKSLDLNRPHYQRLKDLERKVEGHLLALERFSGGSVQGYVVRPTDIRQRELLLVIPKNSPPSQCTWLHQWAARQQKHNLIVSIKMYGESPRASDPVMPVTRDESVAPAEWSSNEGLN